MNKNMIIGYVSYPNTEEARKAARYMVDKDIVACAKVLNNLDVYYKYEGKLNEDKESYLIIKSLENKISDIKDYLKSNHPYQIHEFIYSTVNAGNEEYYKWVESNLINNKLE